MNAGQLTPSEVLIRVAKCAAFIRFSGHAYEQMTVRNVREGDVTAALKSATSATYRPDNDTWRIDGGFDLDGGSLTVAVALKISGDVVVTVFEK